MFHITLKRTALFSLMFASCAASVAVAANFSVDDNGQHITRVCKNNTVQINGNKNVLTLHGNCRMIQVNGNYNTVFVDSVTNIQTDGNNNKVIYRAGKPKVANPGKSNTISRAKPKPRR